MAVVSVATPWRDNWYTEAVVDGLRQTLATEGHEVVVEVVPYGGSTRARVTDLLDGRLGEPDVFGAVVVGFRLRQDESERLLSHGKPVVVTGGTSPWLPSVRVDDVAAARMATGHLIALGHRSIAHVAAFTAMPHDFPVWADRIRGYMETMRAAGLEDLAHVRPSDLRFEASDRAATELLSQPDRPTALFVVTDELAYGVLAAANRLGLAVPADVSVISIDDHPGASGLGLTTIRQTPLDTGVAAAERLLGRTTEDVQLLDIALIQRSTTAPPKPTAKQRGLLGRLLGRGAGPRPT